MVNVATAAVAPSAQAPLPAVRVPLSTAAPRKLIDDLVQLFKLLSDDTRLRILYHLMQTPELHVRALCDLLGESQPAVSHHLALLRNASLIARRRQGKHNYYALRTAGFTSLLDTMFDGLPEGSRRLRFEKYLLTRSPA